MVKKKSQQKAENDRQKKRNHTGDKKLDGPNRPST
ncbi:spore protein [Virgibacillus litoralis]|uniref:Spore protein n=1 Tax=Virgibacillus litoralis TaxID=578221 RepID=A0ABS4HF86_9BACI|nr:spore protein [Virgibacillus litoralis]MBP1949599.1 hypothetical protein [Virgibacillus litoralis]